MENADLVVLGLYLKEFSISPGDIEEFDRRKMAQKVIYLAQYAGADLGYRYSWYSNGPYSPILAEDYYNLLRQSFLINSQMLDNRTLIKPYLSTIHQIRDQLIYAEGKPNLEDHDWAELLASLHYLQKISGYSKLESYSCLEGEKPHLSPFIQEAETKLEELNLL